MPTRVLTVHRKVALSLHMLGIGGLVHNIANVYGLGRSTISRVFRQFIEPMMRHRSTFIRWSTTPQEKQLVKEGFEAKQGFPNCCGAIDAMHIKMELPAGGGRQQLDVMCGMPGVCNDIHVLRSSSLYRKAQTNVILDGPAIRVERHRIREYILGDGGYLNLPWLVIPFPYVERDDILQQFNYKLSSTRIVVERAFGRLKQMWGYLQQRVRQPDVELLPKVIATCCILHNIWKDFSVPFDDDTIVNVEQAPQPLGVAVRGLTTRDVLLAYMRDGHMD
ncbi:hypothetical protein GOP47_0026211 [Adiantum capillus-veneris]|nr:hypothetical protein GOP47_0026211 [Adiantum capillus-veneris]